MSTFARRGRLVLESSIIEDGVVVIDSDRITHVIDVEAPATDDERSIVESTEPTGVTILPGLVDVHCHGGGGESFPNARTPEQAFVAVMEHRRHGTTSLVASLVTADADTLKARAATLTELAKRGEIIGTHFEGPFVSHERCGAQDPEFIIDPDPELTAELIDICDSTAVSMTIAPERPKAWGEGSVAEVLIRGGALPSWGHTDAGAEPARAALEFSRAMFDRVDGPRSPHATITHLFNGMRPLHHRDTGPIAEFLSDAARGGVIVEMICDGIHLAPSLVRDVYEMLGRDACVFVTDAMAAAGMADGDYQLGPQPVSVRDGIARLTGQDTIAGGTAHLLDCVRVAVTRGGIPLVDAVFMASVQGARIIGDPSIGRLAVDGRADLVEVDDELRPLGVWRKGEAVR